MTALILLYLVLCELLVNPINGSLCLSDLKYLTVDKGLDQDIGSCQLCILVIVVEASGRGGGTLWGMYIHLQRGKLSKAVLQ